MKNTFKKILSLVLVIMMIVPMFSFVSSAETRAEPVARLYIWVRVAVFGHSGIYVENLTDGDITVGCYICPKGQGVTVSAANITRKDGKGNYYNIDAYCLNKYGKSGMAWA